MTACPSRHLLRSCLLLGLLLAAIPAWCVDSFCELQKVEVEQVSNALRIRLIANGLQELYANEDDYWTTADGWRQLGPLQRIQFRLRNVRGAPAPIVQIAKYPVSHLEFSLIPGSQQGTGLLCTLVLYKPGYVTAYKGKDDDWDWSQWYWNWPQVTILPTTSQEEIVLTILTDRPAEPERARTAVEQPRSELKVDGAGENLHIRALNADLHELVMAVSRRTGVSVYVDDQIERKVTGSFEHVSLQRLLSTLSMAYGLAVTEDEGALFVAPCTPDSAASAWANATSQITLNYLRPSQAQLLLPTVLLPYLKTSEDNNCLIVSGPRQLVAHVERDLKELDRPGYHCRLKPWLVSWDDEDGDLRETVLQAVGGTTALSATSGGELSLQVGPARAHDALAALRRLAYRRKVKIASMPSMLCSTGQWANLFVGEQIYYWRLTSDYNQDVVLSSVNAGSTLSFSPRSADKWITTRVNVENSFLASVNDLGPLILKRRLNSMVRMQSGDLLVVGGLRHSSADRTRGRTLDGAWPLDAILTGKLKQDQSGEICLLVQAEALPTAPVQSSDGLGVRP